MDEKAKLTSKLPLLIAGLAALGLGLWRLRAAHKLTLGAAVLIATGIGLVAWSETVQDWCAPAEAKFDGATFDQSEWHELSAMDCVRMVMGRQ